MLDKCILQLFTAKAFKDNITLNKGLQNADATKRATLKYAVKLSKEKCLDALALTVFK